MKVNSNFSRLVTVMLILFVFLNINLVVFAESNTLQPFEEQRELTKQEQAILKYKFQKITIRYESGNWVITQGINSELSDMELLKLVGQENIANERLKNIQSKQAIGSGLAIAGILLGLVATLFVTNIIQVENGMVYGIAGIAAGLGLVFLGDRFSPLVMDESEHILTMEEATRAAEDYNQQLKERLGIPNYED